MIQELIYDFVIYLIITIFTPFPQGHCWYIEKDDRGQHSRGRDRSLQNGKGGEVGGRRTCELQAQGYCSPLPPA